jgi:hypothetical protein
MEPHFPNLNKIRRNYSLFNDPPIAQHIPEVHSLHDANVEIHSRIPYRLSMVRFLLGAVLTLCLGLKAPNLASPTGMCIGSISEAAAMA